MPITREQIQEIATKTAGEVVARMQTQEGEIVERDFIIGTIIGEGAIPVHGRETRKAPCRGCRIDPSKPLEPGNVMATTEDAIGTLSPSEIRNWCSEIVELQDGRCERASEIKEAARECKEKYPNDTGRFFTCFVPAFAAVTKKKEDAPVTPEVTPSVRLEAINIQLKQINEEIQTMKVGRPSKNTLAIRERKQVEFDALSKEADKLTQQILHPEAATPQAEAGMPEVTKTAVGNVEIGDWVSFRPSSPLMTVEKTEKGWVTLKDGQGNLQKILVSQQVYQPLKPSAIPKPEIREREARYGFLQLNEAEYNEALTSGRYPEPTRYEKLTAYYTGAHEANWKGLSLAEMFPTKYKDLLKRGVPDKLSPLEVKTVIEEKRIPYGRGVERGVSEAAMPSNPGKTEHLGTIGVTKATLFGRKGEKVGYCLDTPNAIAKALMEFPQAQKVKSILGTYNRNYYENRMKPWNTAQSGFEPVLPVAIPKAEAGTLEVTKEPWQMTTKEFATELETQIKTINKQASQQTGGDVTGSAYRGLTQKAFNELKKKWDVQGLQWTDTWNPELRHKQIIEQALSEGKPVPPEVLKDYPDLKPVTPEVTRVDITKGVIKRGKELIANPDNIPAARAFIAELRRQADETEAKALTTTESKARILNQNARQARRDADRIEQTIPAIPKAEAGMTEIVPIKE